MPNIQLKKSKKIHCKKAHSYSSLNWKEKKNWADWSSKVNKVALTWLEKLHHSNYMVENLFISIWYRQKSKKVKMVRYLDANSNLCFLNKCKPTMASSSGWTPASPTLEIVTRRSPFRGLRTSICGTYKADTYSR